MQRGIRLENNHLVAIIVTNASVKNHQWMQQISLMRNRIFAWIQILLIHFKVITPILYSYQRISIKYFIISHLNQTVKSTSRSMGQMDMVGPRWDPLRTQHHFCALLPRMRYPGCDLEEMSVNHKLKVIQQSNTSVLFKCQEKTRKQWALEGGYRDIKIKCNRWLWVGFWNEKERMIYKGHCWKNQEHWIESVSWMAVLNKCWFPGMRGGTWFFSRLSLLF